MFDTQMRYLPNIGVRNVFGWLSIRSWRTTEAFRYSNRLGCIERNGMCANMFSIKLCVWYDKLVKSVREFESCKVNDVSEKKTHTRLK